MLKKDNKYPTILEKEQKTSLKKHGRLVAFYIIERKIKMATIFILVNKIFNTFVYV